MSEILRCWFNNESQKFEIFDSNGELLYGLVSVTSFVVGSEVTALVRVAVEMVVDKPKSKRSFKNINV